MTRRGSFRRIAAALLTTIGMGGINQGRCSLFFLGPVSRRSNRKMTVRFAILFLSVFASLSCHERNYVVGDGHLEDAGLVSHYPRFRISLENLTVAASATATFRVENCPHSDYSLRLVLKRGAENVGLDEWDGICEMLREANAIVTTSIEGSDHHSGPVQFRGALPGDWDPGAWSNERYFQVDVLRDVELDGDFTIQVQIFLSDPGRVDDDVLIQPVLVGGGFRKS